MGTCGCLKPPYRDPNRFCSLNADRINHTRLGLKLAPAVAMSFFESSGSSVGSMSDMSQFSRGRAPPKGGTFAIRLGEGIQSVISWKHFRSCAKSCFFL